MKNLDYKTVSKLLFPEQQELPQNASQKFDDILRRDFYNMQQERFIRLNPSLAPQVEQEQKYKEIADFMKEHIISVGKEQAIRNFQSGLNFLHKDLIQPLKEDGDFGEKTFKAFYYIFKYYDIEIIKNAIRKGALSNTVIGTSSDKNVNTTAMVKQVNDNLGGIN